MREERIVRNETLYRELNERMREIEEDLSTRGLVEADCDGEYFCECGLDACMEKIRLSTADYEAARSDPARFVIVPDHLIADVERVVRREDGFAIVEKREPERELAIQSDPRRR